MNSQQKFIHFLNNNISKTFIPLYQYELNLVQGDGVQWVRGGWVGAPSLES